MTESKNDVWKVGRNVAHVCLLTWAQRHRLICDHAVLLQDTVRLEQQLDYLE